MRYLLNAVYLLLLLVTGPWWVYQSLRAGKYREGWREKLLGLVPRRVGHRPCVWLHAVSVGEVNLLVGLVRLLEQARPEWECVVSTTTVTGFALARSRFPQLKVFYCPLDFSWAVQAALRRLRPDLLVLAELELWPNLIRLAHDRGTRVAIVNGRLSERSFRGYRRLRPLVAAVLRRLDLVAAQTDEYRERFVQLGARPEVTLVTGSLKYDGARTDRNQAATVALRNLARLRPSDVVFLAGSTQEPEEAVALATFRRLAAEFSALRLILVPRHRERFESVASMLSQSGIDWERRSALTPDRGDSGARVLLVDTIGELGAWWGTADIAFVGGSLGNRGGQNMIEPAAYGAAIAFGPNTRNFRDVVQALLAQRAAVVVQDEHDLTEFVRRCLQDQGQARDLGQRAAELVRANLGATQRTLDRLLALTHEPALARVHSAPQDIPPARRAAG